MEPLALRVGPVRARGLQADPGGSRLGQWPMPAWGLERMAMYALKAMEHHALSVLGWRRKATLELGLNSLAVVKCKPTCVYTYMGGPEVA